MLVCATQRRAATVQSGATPRSATRLRSGTPGTLEAVKAIHLLQKLNLRKRSRGKFAQEVRVCVIDLLHDIATSLGVHAAAHRDRAMSRRARLSRRSARTRGGLRRSALLLRRRALLLRRRFAAEKVTLLSTGTIARSPWPVPCPRVRPLCHPCGPRLWNPRPSAFPSCLCHPQSQMCSKVCL